MRGIEPSDHRIAPWVSTNMEQTAALRNGPRHVLSAVCVPVVRGILALAMNTTMAMPRTMEVCFLAT